MRLAGAEKMGYYPTPPETLRWICERVTKSYRAKRDITLFDPSAGEGEALAAIAEKLEELGMNPTTYGVELSPERARVANEVIDKLVRSDYFEMDISPESMDMVLLNPPYDADWSESRQRLEFTFLESVTELVSLGGIVIYLVPDSVLDRPEVTRHIAQNYTTIFEPGQIHPDEYDQFNQVLLVLRKRHTQLNNNYNWVEEKLKSSINSMRHGHGNIVRLAQYLRIDHSIEPEKEEVTKKIIFKQRKISYEEVASEVVKKGGHTTPDWQDVLEANQPGVAEFRPATELRAGHLVALLVSGKIPPQQINTENGVKYVAGRELRDMQYFDKEGNLCEKGDPDVDVAIQGNPRPAITLLDENGGMTIIKTEEELEPFLQQYGQDLLKKIQEQYKPLYAGDPTPEEWAAVNRIKPTTVLPGEKEAKLVEGQQHLIVTYTRILKKYKSAFAVADMGSGKTFMALATAEMTNSWPAMVICPPHLRKEWKAAVKELWPDSKPTICKSPTDVDKALAAHRPGDRTLLISGSTNIRQGSPWIPQVNYKTRKVRNPETWQMMEVTEPVCPRCQATVELKETQTVRCEAKVLNRRTGKKEICNEALYMSVSKRKGEPVFSKPDEPVSHKWSIARYIAAKYPRNIKILLADEAHEYAKSNSLQSHAYHLLTGCVEYVLNLTGTLFNGKADDLFTLLYRNNKNVRNAYAHNDVSAWTEKFGVVQYPMVEEKEGSSYVTSTKKLKKSNGKVLPGVSAAIYPMVLPQTVFSEVEDLGFWLPGLTETYVPIKPVQEVLDQQALHLDALGDQIRLLLSTYDTDSRRLAMRLMSPWFTECIFRPSSAFRTTVMTRTTDDPEIRKIIQTPESSAEKDLCYPWDHEAHTIFAEQKSGGAPMILGEVRPNEIHPKEQWLIDEINRQKARGRKTIVYVNQTGDRDIQQRLLKLLQENLIRALILDGVNADDRVAWIKKKAPDIDVLITNPRKVETGMNLTMFQTGIFYEISTRLATTWQAMKRIRRPGQLKDVEIYIAYYTGTYEDFLLALMQDKMKAASTLYGRDLGFNDPKAEMSIMEQLLKGTVSTDVAKPLFGEIKASAPREMEPEPEPEIKAEPELEMEPEPEPEPMVVNAPEEKKEEAPKPPKKKFVIPPASKPVYVKQEAAGQMSLFG